MQLLGDPGGEAVEERRVGGVVSELPIGEAELERLLGAELRGRAPRLRLSRASQLRSSGNRGVRPALAPLVTTRR